MGGSIFCLHKVVELEVAHGEDAGFGEDAEGAYFGAEAQIETEPAQTGRVVPKDTIIRHAQGGGIVLVVVGICKFSPITELGDEVEFEVYEAEVGA